MARMRVPFVLAVVLLLIWRAPPSHAFQGLAAYLPLHTFMETLAIIVAMLVFGVGWHAYNRERPGNLVLLSCAFLAVGLIDFAHALSYKGMPEFVTPSGPEKAINFWLAARFTESLALLGVAVLPWRPFASAYPRYAFLAGGLAWSAFVYWVGLYHADALPRTFIEGRGLTPVKIGTEYAIIAIHVLTAARLAVQARRPQPFDVGNLLSAAAVLVLSELCFTLYSSVTDAFNLLGHVYKVVAYTYIYRAVFVDSVREPFRRLHEAQELIWEEKERAQVTLESIGDAVITTDGEGRVEYLNHVAEVLAGWGRAAAAGKPLGELFHLVNEASGEPAPDPVAECLRTGGAVALANHTVLVRRDGRRFAIEDSAAPIRDRRGRVVGVVMVFHDVTERKRAEETRARLSAILEATSDLIAIGSADGRLLYLNGAARRALGFEPEAGLGALSCLDLYTAWERERVRDEVLPAALRRGVWRGETVLATRDGHEIPVSQVIVVHRTDGEAEFLSFIATDIRERKRFERQLEYLADHDPLTGLFNRHRFNLEVAGRVECALRTGTHGALLFLDLDNFKYINDTLGHQAGDELLALLPGILRSHLGEEDVLARLGGDEFAVLLPCADAEAAQGVAREILHSIGRQGVEVAGERVEFTVSIGIALFPEHGATVEDLIAHADLAVHRAKEEGRNRVCLYTLEGDWFAEARAKLTWEKRIRQALEQDRFILHFQPILDLRHPTAPRWEALLRMVGEDGEVIPPGAFLGVAERFGLIHEIDRWVARAAIRHLAGEQRAGRRPCLEVNLSGKAFDDPELLPLIEEELSRAAIDPADLVWEITETAAVANINKAQEFIRTLRSLGCGFALDDFGVGFSSFNYLKHLPVDYLKIDGGFIRDLPRNPVDQHLVRAMVEVAHGLGKRTIAEFVGDEATLRLLREYGVDYAQGYFIGRPEPQARAPSALAPDAAEDAGAGRAAR